jgi:hypothetical protein
MKVSDAEWANAKVWEMLEEIAVAIVEGRWL